MSETVWSDIDLMRLHADILFSYDRRGRMLRSNEPESIPAPRVYLGYTREEYILRFGVQMGDAIAEQISEIVRHRTPEGAGALSDTLRGEVRAALGESGAEDGGPVYRFPALIPALGAVAAVTNDWVEPVRDSFPWLAEDVGPYEPCFAVVQEGAAVSICFSSRLGAAACEAGVVTLPGFRGRGYAAAVTAAWGAAVRAGGRVPLYSTSWENRASQGVARRVGLIAFGAEVSWE